MYEHQKYFMPDVLYKLITEAQKTKPFNRLRGEDWYNIFSHLFAHEVEGVSPKGHLEALMTHSIRYALNEAITDYIQENNGRSNEPLFSNQERDTYGVVLRLQKHLRSYEVITKNPQFVPQLLQDVILDLKKVA